MINELKNLNDSELLMLYHEDDEIAKNLLYMKYKCIIDILINKYRKMIVASNIDFQEIYSECTLGFSDGLKSYQENKNTSLPTFLTICVERRIIFVLRKYNQEKYKILKDAYSLDAVPDNLDRPFIELISDSKENDPLMKITDFESSEEFIKGMKAILTAREYEVFLLLLRNFNYQEIAKILNCQPKQIDNTIQRVKNKVKIYLKREKL